jgi:YidC/Oxa1 family membrane protein insertase
MDQRNLILAIVISAAIYIAFYFLYEKPRLEQMQAQQQAAQEQQQAQQQQQPQQQQPAPGTEAPGATSVPSTTAAPAPVDRAAALTQSPRIAIDSPRLEGSIALRGGRIDDVVLKDYRETVDPNSPNIVLLSPAAAPDAYFAEVGWVGEGTKLPNDETIWRADGDRLSPDKPLTLTWDNGEGVRFTRVFALDRNFMLSMTERVENGGDAVLTLYPFGRIRRVGTPALGISQILHEGPIGAFGNLVSDGKFTLRERQYDDLKGDGPCTVENPVNRFESVGGWLGITDKYWLVALIPHHQQRFTACYRWELVGGKDTYQTDYLGTAVSVAPDGTSEARTRLFAGAKEVRLLDAYRDGRFGDAPIPLFDRAVDFSGYLGYFLTLIAKPLFYLLDYIYLVVGNFGIAIMLLTVLVKLVFFPLANKSYRAMNKMKKLAPLMQELRQRFGEDKARLNQEMMGLYKREKVNPAAGCLPILVQIPVFIALYQVLYVTIEMRHAPFFGWIRDLSAPDPTSILNLFGLLPYDVPNLGFLHILSIGVWPLVMGVTMFLQQKMNPPPPDPVQAKIFMFLPIMFTFMLAQFAAGLVIYWAWNNLLSIGQQWLLKRMDERREAHAARRIVEKPKKPEPEEAEESTKPAKAEKPKKPEPEEAEESTKPAKAEKPKKPEPEEAEKSATPIRAEKPKKPAKPEKRI